jgi:hypothetical protein
VSLDREERLVLLALIVVLLTCVIGLVIYEVEQTNAKHACEDRGGSYDSYNCRTTYVPMTTYCGSGCTNTVIVPTTTCDYHCVGAAKP